MKVAVTFLHVLLCRIYASESLLRPQPISNVEVYTATCDNWSSAVQSTMSALLQEPASSVEVEPSACAAATEMRAVVILQRSNCSASLDIAAKALSPYLKWS